MSTDWRFCFDSPREAAMLIDDQRAGLAIKNAENERLRQLLDNEHSTACRLRTQLNGLRVAFQRLRNGISYADNAHECDLADAALAKVAA